MRWSVPELWKKSDAFIIGGGPSVKDLDLTPIHNKRVIGVNNAYTLGHWVDVCYFGDCRWWDWNREVLRDYPCLKVTCCERLDKIKHLKILKRQPQGFSTDPNAIAWNGNSGASAINLAYLLGARRAFLVGYDMKMNGQNHNWHEDHKHKPINNIYTTKFIPQFKRMAKFIKGIDFEVFNLNPDSSLDIFPFLSFEEAVRMAK